MANGNGGNTAVGGLTLSAASTSAGGANNIAVGVDPGNKITGSNNIHIANLGTSGDSNGIRIGSSANQNAFYLLGVYLTQVTGSPVVVSSSGLLRTVVSSEGFKTDIAPMVDAEKLSRLRPVTFHLKSGPQRALGLDGRAATHIRYEIAQRLRSVRCFKNCLVTKIRGRASARVICQVHEAARFPGFEGT